MAVKPSDIAIDILEGTDNLEDPGELDAIERRRDERFAAKVEVRFSVPSQAARALRAYSLNVSLGGLCLKPNRPYAVGTALQLAIYVNSEELLVDGTVAWERDGAIGVRFVDLSPGDRERLARLIGQVST